MLRFFHGLLFALFLISPAAAQISDPYTSITKEELRAAIYAGEVRKVEAAFREAQAKFLRGEANIDDLRWLNEVFTTTHPDVISFTKTWLKRYPNSPYANTAQAWINYKIGWIIRGEKIAIKIYPEALKEFSRLHYDAWDHAIMAYEIDPRYIPASDALIRLANSTSHEIKAYKVLHQVMLDDPNWGTLRRAVESTRPGWGGTWEMAVRMCDLYGPMIEFKYDTVLYCKAYAGAEVFPNGHGEWAVETIRKNRIKYLDYLRLYSATSDRATRAEAAFAYNFLTRDGITNAEYAKRFDRNVARKYGYDFISEAHQRRAHDYAREALEDDPYDPDLIKIMQAGISRYSVDEGGRLHSKLIERLSPEEEIEYARRLLVIAPYNSRHYSDYARVKYNLAGTEGFLKDEPFLINAIVYSNHDPIVLHSYVFDKWQQLDGMQQSAEGLGGPEWRAVSERVNLDADIICPMLRGYRLLKSICETTRTAGCDYKSEQREVYEIVLADAIKRNVCISERTTPGFELYYTPIPVDLSPPQ